MIRYIPDFVPNRIMIVGCGGTGSRVVPLIAQFIKTCKWVLNPEILLIDDDVVEEKNLSRQNFIQTDVGKPKAVVLANRYSKAFGTTIFPVVGRINTEFMRNDYKAMTDPSAYPEKDKIVGEVKIEGIHCSTSSEQKDALIKFGTFMANSIVILCVDSPESRKSILGAMLKHAIHGVKVLVIDAGNEDDFGQVKVGHIAHTHYSDVAVKNLPEVLPGDMDIPVIPLDVNYFTTMTAKPNSLSCADLDQTMAINTAMATTIFGIVQNVYYAKPLTYHRIDVSLTYGSIPQLITRNYLRTIRDDTSQVHIENYHKRVYGVTLPIFDISSNFSKFYKEVYAPIAKAIKAAEDKAALEALKKTQEVKLTEDELPKEDIDTDLAKPAKSKAKRATTSVAVELDPF